MARSAVIAPEDREWWKEQIRAAGSHTEWAAENRVRTLVRARAAGMSMTDIHRTAGVTEQTATRWIRGQMDNDPLLGLRQRVVEWRPGPQAAAALNAALRTCLMSLATVISRTREVGGLGDILVKMALLNRVRDELAETRAVMMDGHTDGLVAEAIAAQRRVLAQGDDDLAALEAAWSAFLWEHRAED